MAIGYNPDVSHLRICEPQVQAFLSSQKREGKLSDCTRSGRYVGHADSGTMCIILDEKVNRLLKGVVQKISNALMKHNGKRTNTLNFFER